jgi:hypothetical protein
VRGHEIELTHFGEQLKVNADSPITRNIEAIPHPAPIKQPKGRAPDEIKTTGTHLDETGALLEVEGDYPHQSGSAV